MATSVDSPSQASGDTGGAPDRPWEMRFWSGMNFTGFARLLARNRFAVSPTRIPMAMILAGLSVFNSCLWMLGMLFQGRKIARTELVDDPIFVLGHWRTGTTLLHELLAADPRHTYPDTRACFGPNHFLFMPRALTWLLRVFLPSRRPMDDMPVDWDSPQEDEWALCNMGLPSPYLTIAFPNRPPQCQEYIDLRDLPPEARERWKQGLRWFLKCLTVQRPKRIVLKTPLHTARVRVLLEMFPNARFVHIVRNPYVVFPSIIMYEVFEEDRALVDPSRFCEVRYEDLVRDPVGQMRAVYEGLGLGGFDEARPALEAYAASHADYRPNRHQLDPRICEEITRRWSAYVQKYGYRPPVEGA